MGLLMFSGIAAYAVATEGATRNAYFMRAAQSMELLGDRNEAERLRRLAYQVPTVPPRISDAGRSAHPDYTAQYDALWVRLNEAMLRPVHSSEDQWRVDRTEAALHLVSHELSQGRSAMIPVIQQYLHDASYALNCHIVPNGPVQAASSAAVTAPTRAPTAPVTPAAPAAVVPAPVPLPTAAISATPNSIRSGASSLISWATTDAKRALLNGEPVALRGTRSVSPTASTTYALEAFNDAGRATDQARVTVAAPLSPTAWISADPQRIDQGQSSVITWSTSNATRAELNGRSVALQGSEEVTPATDASYMLVATGPGGQATDEDRILVDVAVAPQPTAPLPPTISISVTPDRVNAGDLSRLTWSSTRATTVRINGAREETAGSRAVYPAATHIFYAMAEGPGGQARDSATLTVIKEAVRRFTVLFDFDEYVIRADAEDTIAQFVRFMRDNPATRVLVQGHTDAIGGEAYNKALSERRAQAVYDYVMIQFGFSPDRFVTVGRGEMQPVSTNEHSDGTDNPEGRAMNRRADLVVIE